VDAVTQKGVTTSGVWQEGGKARTATGSEVLGEFHLSCHGVLETSEALFDTTLSVKGQPPEALINHYMGFQSEGKSALIFMDVDQTPVLGYLTPRFEFLTTPAQVDPSLLYYSFTVQEHDNPQFTPNLQGEYFARPVSNKLMIPQDTQTWKPSKVTISEPAQVDTKKGWTKQQADSVAELAGLTISTS